MKLVKEITVVGAGWAGLAAAVAATQKGWRVTLFEASQTAGGRARNLPLTYADLPLDNGQHILIGAYTHTLDLMKTVGLDPAMMLERTPLDLRDAQDRGLALSNWPTPLNLLVGVVCAKGWSFLDKFHLLNAALKWQRDKFMCPAHWTVQELCQTNHITSRVWLQLIKPLCISALNTPAENASASVFLRVLNDAIMTGNGSSDLLIPKVPLGDLLPNSCLKWLAQKGASIRLGERLTSQMLQERNGHTILACPPWEAARLVADICPDWAKQCDQLHYTAITTVYLECNDPNFQRLKRPMMALDDRENAPAQFVFDKGALTHQPKLLAAVISASNLNREQATEQVQHQLEQQLGLRNLKPIETITEKRATFACVPNLKRPGSFITKNLWACGDYIEGPYPATLEGAVRSGQNVIAHLT